MFLLAGIAGVAVLALIVILCAIAWRRVVPPNEVHIVNRGKTSTPYGNNMDAGNVYYAIPSFLPIIGVVAVIMPTTIFDIELDGYKAYDQQKVPFVVDVISFFQLEDAVAASKRVSSLQELYSQLEDMLKGVVRKILAGHDVAKIMETRAELSESFIKEVKEQSAAWGVKANQIEFTDIRDEPEGDHHVIADIMQRKTSLIEKERRVEVAENMKVAEVAEIEAKQIADIRRTEALEATETRDADRTKKVGIAQEMSKQEVQEQAKVTASKAVEVAKATAIGTASFEKEKKIIEADATRESVTITAEGNKQAALLKADGDTAAVERVGLAEAKVVKEKALAAAEGEIKRAESVKALNDAGKEVELGKVAIEAQRAIGIEMAKAYASAEIKAYLSNGKGIDGLKDLLSAPGGVTLASFLDSFKDATGGMGLLDLFKSFTKPKDSPAPAAEKPSAPKADPSAQSGNAHQKSHKSKYDVE